jgi:hypothetical protein
MSEQPVRENEGSVEDDPIVIVCQGPPRCALEGDEAIAAQETGCRWCRRIIVHADGSETDVEPSTC